MVVTGIPVAFDTVSINPSKRNEVDIANGFAAAALGPPISVEFVGQGYQSPSLFPRS